MFFFPEKHTVPYISRRGFGAPCLCIRYLITLQTAGPLKGILDMWIVWGYGKWETWAQNSLFRVRRAGFESLVHCLYMLYDISQSKFLNFYMNVCKYVWMHVPVYAHVCVHECPCVHMEYLPASHTAKNCELQGMSTWKEKGTQGEGRKRWGREGCSNFNALSQVPCWNLVCNVVASETK